jgi:hypothetical protein
MNQVAGTLSSLVKYVSSSFYDFWNEYLRQEFVIAIGQLDRDEQNREVFQQRLRENASHDLWGDLRHLRTSIVHHLGVATDDVARCKLAS